MRAAYITATGPPSAITCGELPDPAPGPTDVLVRVEASAVNQVDTFVRSGRYPTPTPFPFVVGRDLVGAVEAAGPGTGFAAGDRVWCNSLGHGGRQGACSELAVVAADRLYRLPSAAAADPFRTVAALHPAATAFLGLHLRARVRAGQTVYVGGAAGSVGACATALAVAAGVRVVGSARPADFDRVRGLGASAVVDYADPDLTGRLLEAAPDGVDLYWDTSGRARLRDAVPAVRPGGCILVTAGREPQPQTPWWPFYTRDVTVTGFVISRATAAELAVAAEAVNRVLAGPGFAVEVAEVLPLAETARAHALVEGGTRGRVVVQVG